MNSETLCKEYESYRLALGKSIKTVDLEVAYIRYFHNYLEKINQSETLPVDHITYKMMESFFEKECERLQPRTVYRKITIMCNYFDFLSQKQYIYTDFMPKFRKRFKKLSWEEPKLQYDYEKIIEKKPQILEDESIRLAGKVIYLFMVYALELREMMEVTKDSVTIKDDYILISISTDKNVNDRVIKLTDPLEHEVIKRAIEEADNRGVPYLLSSKTHGIYGMYNATHLRDSMNSISHLLGIELTSTKQARYAYINYLSISKNMSVDEISSILGIQPTTTAKLIKNAMERIETN